MRTDLKIDFVALPFAGHLFPQLQLAKYAKMQGINRLRFHSSPKMREAVEHAGIEFLPHLADRETEVLDCVAEERYLNNIKKEINVFSTILDLMPQCLDELRNYWQANRPDLVIADFCTSQFVGAAADEMGISCWTSCPSPTAVESRKGTPPLCGGWMPPKTIIGKCRDAWGRSYARLHKKIGFCLFRKRLQALGFKSVYRNDGSERAFSNDVILGLGIPEFEFENEWPQAMHWLGPCTESPVFDHPAPHYEPGKKHIFASLGTQLPWAKKHAEDVFREVSQLLPDKVFHFTLGNPDLKEPRIEKNLHCHGYIPYTPESFRNYDVICNHGGVGVLYTAMMAGVPQLILPHDYDQHDNAARIVHHGLGLRSQGKPKDIAAKISQLLQNDFYRKRAKEYQQIVERYNPGQTFIELLKKRFS
jgi:UDP:flavonoid glycosyltransferase YjiC (YdhE family)